MDSEPSVILQPMKIMATPSVAKQMPLRVKTTDHKNSFLIDFNDINPSTQVKNIHNIARIETLNSKRDRVLNYLDREYIQT